MTRFTTACALALTLYGCGGGGGPEVGVNEDNVCAEAAEVFCYDIYRCCTEGEIESILMVDEPRTEAQCRDDITIACERGLAPIRWSLEQGRVELQADVLNACLEALIAPDDSCAIVASFAPWAEVCAAEAWEGTVPAGGDCYYDVECAGEGSYCTIGRTCEALPGDGEPCPEQVCAAGHYCSGGTCAPRFGAGDLCIQNVQCLESLFCDFSIPTPVCTEFREVGEACSGSDQCVSRLCVPGTCESSGQTCFEDDDCGGECEDDGSVCFDDSQCGAGTCTMSLGTCFSDFDCNGGGDVCAFEVACLPSDCLGEPSCAENLQTFDYCEDIAAAIPL
jgi:hypothetical protein